MAEVILPIGGRDHVVACRDGEEPRLRMLGDMIEARWDAASRAAGIAGTERAMLFVALMLADDLDDAASRPPIAGGVSEAALEQLAERLERLAGALEHESASA